MKELRFDSQEKWLEALVEKWQEWGSACLGARGTFSVALSGGSSPQAFYEALTKIDWTWDATEMFVGDERRVPPDHPDSNYKMMWEAFHPKRIKLHRWKTEDNDLQAASLDFSKQLTSVLGNPPRFDLILLGIGNDGHTASLFPETAALNETDSFTVVNQVPQLSTTRLTLTYPVIEKARAVWFLSKGEGKQPWIDKMTAGDTDSCPAAQVICQESEPLIFNWN
ncbi:MAG: 6-phosphogluconolactonase [Verrucomicrobiota bacterium]